MEPHFASVYTLLSEAFRYPTPGHFTVLKKEMKNLPAGSYKLSLQSFLDKIGRLSLGEWEELHTRTLDLNPPAAPYVGFQTWGESYQRGIFLSKMNRALMENDIDPDGELPDHLSPILSYLGQVSEPLSELIEVLNPAVQRMLVTLRNAEPGNPYVHLLDAVQLACKGLNVEAV